MKRVASSGMPVRESLLNVPLFAERPVYKAAWGRDSVWGNDEPAILVSEIMEISLTAFSDALSNGTM